MKVKDVMTKKVVTVGPSDKALDVGNMLHENRISSAVVVDKGEIKGMISKEGFLSSVKYLDFEDPDSFKVSDLMTSRFEKASPDEDLCDVVFRMNNAYSTLQKMIFN